MIDSRGRTINYLRLSVTDRCNLRCCYCMPAQGVPACRHDEILRYEELLRIARAAAELGIQKIRVTGGEPLVRKGLLSFLRQLCQITGIDEVTMTTNGLLLPENAEKLKVAGVERINVSLDSLQPDTYRRITLGGDLSRVLHGLKRAEQAGMQIKLNMVVMRGVNDHEVEDFAVLTLDRPWSVRFIEYMPTIQEQGWQKKIIPGAEILDRLRKRFTLKTLLADSHSGPARLYRIHHAPGLLGVIAPISEHFCASCNRIRVTSRGEARGCLLSNAAIDLKPALAEDNDLELRKALARVARSKVGNHQYLDDSGARNLFSMSSVGG